MAATPNGLFKPDLSDAALAERVQAVVRDQSHECIQMLRALLSAARDGEEAIQTEVVWQLRDYGLEPEEIVRAPSQIETAGEFASAAETEERERRTVAARRRGSGGGRSLLLWAHPDGMLFDGAAGWSVDPFAGEVRDGRIYGWGIGDDLSGVAALLMIPRMLRILKVELPGDVLFVSALSKGHASGILAALEAGYLADAGIYLHPAESGNGLGEIKALAPGMLRLRLTVHGRPPDTPEPNHALFAHQGVNPVDKMLLLLNALRQLDEQRNQRLRHPMLAEQHGRVSSLLIATLAAGELPSRMPRDCSASLTFTLPPGEALDAARNEIEQVVQQTAASDAWLSERAPQIEWRFGTTGVEVAPDAPLYRTVEGAIAALTGATPRYYASHIASEIRQPILNAGMPAVGIGPRAGDLTQAGGHDEWLEIDDYLRVIAVCTLATIHWCGASRS